MTNTLINYSKTNYVLASCLIILPFSFGAFGYFAVIGLGLWLLLYVYYCFRKNIPWWNKVLVFAIPYLIISLAVGGKSAFVYYW